VNIIHGKKKTKSEKESLEVLGLLRRKTKSRPKEVRVLENWETHRGNG